MDLEEVFSRAVELRPEDREAFLATSGVGPALRREVESLLRADAHGVGFLETPLPSSLAGFRIGPFRLSRRLGEGQSSVVYLAERCDGTYQQQVAIKLIRSGIHSEQLLQNFRYERQILASLSHPNIARLLDGGTTTTHRPYLVMEHVDGEAYDRFCAVRKLPLARRLELFCTICEAVHFAHRNLIVHRDLKPSNILVDTNGTPKLLDFGIAKLLDPSRLAAEEEHTVTIAPMMTPHYASPEQVSGGPISTSSDVYSLGVNLYTLITGQRPYEFESLSSRDIERTVCHVVPRPPSQVLSATERRRFPRDLDHVVAMALRKEPGLRYSSAQELADDIRRSLSRDPVRARPDTVGYRFASFVRRHRGALAVAVAFVALLGAAATTATVEWRRALVAQARAENERQVAQQSLGFLIDLFDMRNAPMPLRDVSAKAILDRGVERLRTDAEHLTPMIQAAFYHTLGVVYRNLGDSRQAARLLDVAVAERSGIPSMELELADSLYELGAISGAIGEPDRAKLLLKRALGIREHLLGVDDPAVADVLEAFADNAAYKVPLDVAIHNLQRALDIRRRHPGVRDSLLISTMSQLARLYMMSSDTSDADRLLSEMLAMRDRYGETCLPADGDVFDALWVSSFRDGKYRVAEHYLDRAIDCRRLEVGQDHISVVDLEAMKVPIWREQGRYADAEQLARASLEKRRAMHGEGTPAHDNALHHLAFVLFERGKLAEAESVATAALAMRRREYGRVHSSVAASVALLGDIALAKGDATAAESSYREALEIWHELGGDSSPDSAAVLRRLAEARLAQNQLDDARTTAARALGLQRTTLRDRHPAIAETLTVLGKIALVQSAADAEPLLRVALGIQVESLGPLHVHVARTNTLLAECLVRQGRFSEAKVLLRHAIEVLQVASGNSGDDLARASALMDSISARRL